MTHNFVIFIFRAGKPMPGLHLDVTKEGKMVQVPYRYLNIAWCVKYVIKSQHFI